MPIFINNLLKENLKSTIVLLPCAAAAVVVIVVVVVVIATSLWVFIRWLDIVA